MNDGHTYGTAGALRGTVDVDSRVWLYDMGVGEGA